MTRSWLPLHKMWRPFEAALIMPTFGVDLIATFNRIPLGAKPFVISFETHLPRLFGYENSRAFQALAEQLCSSTCRKIVPISHFAARTFKSQHIDRPWGPDLLSKLSLPIYPSVEVPPYTQPETQSGQPLRAVFVGSHFSRKGGLACLVAAKLAHECGLNVEWHIVSDLTMGRQRGVWTDPNDVSFLNKYLALLELPNVIHHGRLPNNAALRLLRSADVSLLPTLSDSFGYSIIESLAQGVPVVGTRLCAISEIITDGIDGFLLDIDTDQNDEWAHLNDPQKDTPRFRALYDETINSLGRQILDRIKQMVDQPEIVDAMKKAAHETARTRFNAESQSVELDNLYESSMG